MTGRWELTQGGSPPPGFSFLPPSEHWRWFPPGDACVPWPMSMLRKSRYLLRLGSNRMSFIQHGDGDGNHDLTEVASVTLLTEKPLHTLGSPAMLGLLGGLVTYAHQQTGVVMMAPTVMTMLVSS
jgi:hypothetical protein